MDPYRVLGLQPGASRAEIKSAFKKLALIHHPDLHANSSESVQKAEEATFRALNEAHQALTDGNYRYRQASAPGRAGFRRASNSNSSSNSSYGYGGASGYSGYAGGQSYRARSGPSFRSGVRMFVNSGSLMATAVLAGLALAGVLVMEPLVSSLWEDRNRGKLFSHIEDDLIVRHRAQLEVMRAARAARAAAAAREAMEAPIGAGFAAQGAVGSSGSGGGGGGGGGEETHVAPSVLLPPSVVAQPVHSPAAAAELPPATPPPP